MISETKAGVLGTEVEMQLRTPLGKPASWKTLVTR
jgi:hypothetical protein